mgnify:CR=1 FL=1
MKSWQISPINKSIKTKIQSTIDNKTKPVGSLGKLEELAAQLAMIASGNKINICQPAILVFAADHGIAKHNVSIAGSEVTQLMVANFLRGGAAINCFCRSNDIALKVIDAGMKTAPQLDSSALVSCRVGNGTHDFSEMPAMLESQLNQCLTFGSEVVQQQIDLGTTLIGFGEMGIGNTSSASAILSALTGVSTEFSVGVGTGINDEQLTLKKRLVGQGVSRITNTDPMNILMEVGGFEIAQICGAMLTAGSNQIPFVVDGFIVTAAAMLAQEINSNVTDYMIFAHSSQEPGHELMLAHLQAKPLLDLSLRLGEGTGAALAIPIIKCAASFYNDMASFEQANIEV